MADHSGNVQPQLDIEEHDHANKAKRVSLIGGDIEIGAVELKDGDSDTRADIDAFGGSYNALAVGIVADNDKFIKTNIDEGNAVGSDDAIPIAAEDSSGNKVNLKVDENSDLQVGISEKTLTQIIDDTGDADSTVYIGWAVAGSLATTGGTIWRIKRIQTPSGTPTITTVAWAGGTTGFDYEWDERASYAYS